MYAAMVSALDDGVGEVMGAVKQAGLLENTLVVLVGRQRRNYGEARGPESGFRAWRQQRRVSRIQVQPVRWRHARAGHDELARRDPGRGRKSRELAMSMDILPTICKAAGARSAGWIYSRWKRHSGSRNVASQVTAPGAVLGAERTIGNAARPLEAGSRWQALRSHRRRGQDDRRRRRLPLQPGRRSRRDNQSSPQTPGVSGRAFHQPASLVRWAKAGWRVAPACAALRRFRTPVAPGMRSSAASCRRPIRRPTIPSAAKSGS